MLRVILTDNCGSDPIEGIFIIENAKADEGEEDEEGDEDVPKTDNITSIRDAVASAFSVSPNPVLDVITLSFGYIPEGNVHIEFCEVSGKCIASLFNAE